MAFQKVAQNTVVRGEFNRAIIRPDWLVKMDVVLDGEVSMGLSFRPAAARSFRFAGFDWEVGADRLVLKPQAPEFQDPGPTVAKILELLPHTPLTAIGHNFLFHGSGDIDPKLFPQLGPLAPNDVAQQIETGTTAVISSWSITLDSAKGYRLTAKVMLEPTNQKIDVNFHFALTDSASARAIEAAERFSECGQRAQELVAALSGD